MSDSPSPHKETKMTGWGPRSASLTADTLSQPQRGRSCNHCAETHQRKVQNASLDLGILQKPQLFPMHPEHKYDTLPNGICETKQEAGASPVNLTNLRLKCKGALLKGTQQTSIRCLLDCWALVGYPVAMQSAGSSWNCASLTFWWRP